MTSSACLSGAQCLIHNTLHSIAVAVPSALNDHFDNSGEELDSGAVKEKGPKMAYLDKLIALVGVLQEAPVDVRSSKIVAGLEPENTNALLLVRWCCTVFTAFCPLATGAAPVPMPQICSIVPVDSITSLKANLPNTTTPCCCRVCHALTRPGSVRGQQAAKADGVDLNM